jgi:predicted  nucleic acid-binding Zn-ribbon protein
LNPLAEELYSKVSKIEATISKMETIIDEHSRLLDRQQNKNEVQTELNTLLRLQIEANKEQSKQLEKFGDTLDRIDTNLTNLNNSQQSLGERVSEIEGIMSDQKIDTVKLVKSIFAYVLTAAGGILLTILYIRIGLK